jgi:stress-induced morphogen
MTGSLARMTTADTIINRIRQQLPSAEIKATDLTGGGDHWQVSIRAAEFKGKSLIEQHQMIYAALGEMMRQEIHALSLDTKEA